MQAGALGFGGQVTEPGTDLQYLRARYYDPQTAQFLTRDPQEAITGQPYLYAAGNPVMFTDPTGESIFGDFFAGLVTGASFGQVKPGGANRCSYLNFAGEQLGGILDPFRKIKAAGKVAGAQRGLPWNGYRPYAPTRELPRYPSGRPRPESKQPHTQIGTRKGRYPQSREFDENGKPLRDIDWTDHGSPDIHTDPHQHAYGSDGSRGAPESFWP